jgi:protein-disulfide isomerase
LKLNLPYFGPITVDLPYFAGGLVGTLLILGGLGYWLWGTGGSTTIAGGRCTPKDTFTVAADEFTRGDAKAPITIIEYASMTCPHCARFNNDVLPHLEADYIDKGYVRYVFRDFPLDMVAMTVSVVGRCLPHDQYLPFVALMYQTQQQWLAVQNGEELRASIKEMARRAGLSGDAFEACLTKSDKDVKTINAIQQQGVNDYCINGTPTLFMNNKPLASGEISYKDLDKKVRDELKRLGKTAPPPSAAATAPEPTATPPAGGAPTPPADSAATPPAEGSAPAEGPAPADSLAAPPPPPPPAPAASAPAAPPREPPN